MTTTEDIDFEERRLCPDGACIGVIGDDGRCKVCGRADDGSVVAPGTAPGIDIEDSVLVEGGGDPFEDDDRELCPDGACIGVIGSDGKCKVCGRSRGS